jgi:hypothetical protein
MVGDLHLDDGGWAACSICHDLVEAGDRDELLKRSYESFIYNHPEALIASQKDLDRLREMIRTLHVQFFENKLEEAPKPVYTGVV